MRYHFRYKALIKYFEMLFLNCETLLQDAIISDEFAVPVVERIGLRGVPKNGLNLGAEAQARGALADWYTCNS
jgi:hypothetical protein